MFETSPIIPPTSSRTKPFIPVHTRDDSIPEYGPVTPGEDPQKTAFSTIAAPPGFESSPLPIRTPSVPIGEPLTKTSTDSSETKFTPAKISKQPPAGNSKTGIPINRAGQRIDRRMQIPTTQDQERFEARIRYRKLCNEHHLRDNCYQYNCKYDHDPIDPNLMNTLRYKARGIPCQSGMKCRRLDCYYGHHCPWGADACTNPRCAFIKAGLHDISDLEIAKFVEPTPV